MPSASRPSPWRWCDSRFIWGTSYGRPCSCWEVRHGGRRFSMGRDLPKPGGNNLFYFFFLWHSFFVEKSDVEEAKLAPSLFGWPEEFINFGCSDPGDQSDVGWTKALPGYLFFLPRLFVLSRVLFSKGYSDLFSHLDRHCFSWMLSRVSITITCSAYGSSAPTLVENTVVLNAWCLVNVLMHLIMNGNKNVIEKNQEQ